MAGTDDEEVHDEQAEHPMDDEVTARHRVLLEASSMLRGSLVVRSRYLRSPKCSERYSTFRRRALLIFCRHMYGEDRGERLVCR